MIAGGAALRRLKEETAGLHEQAERYVHILDPRATLDDYRRYLAAMWGFHAPLERAFAAHAGLAAAGFDAPGRARCDLAARDLRALGDARDAWPEAPRVPDTGELARAIGAAYVIEGSTLGGRFILANLPPPIAEVRGTATAFLAGYGRDTGARWRAYGALVEASLPPAEVDTAIAAAQATFEDLIAWLR